MRKIIVFVLLLFMIQGCDSAPANPVSTSGVKKANIIVKTNAAGLTVEQENVKARLVSDNKPGSIKHLYVISAMSGQVILYSTVKGKVTSSGKRLAPLTVEASQEGCIGSCRHNGLLVDIGGKNKATSEVLQDDGTYGSSIPYVFWWDVQGRYHQHYISGGQIMHISDQPIVVKNIILNLEQQK